MIPLDVKTAYWLTFLLGILSSMIFWIEAIDYFHKTEDMALTGIGIIWEMIGFVWIVSSVKKVSIVEGPFEGDSIVDENGKRVREVPGIPIQYIERNGIYAIIFGLSFQLWSLWI